MDILAHSLWTAAAAKAANKKKKKPLNIWLAAFWGIFPDLYAFGIPFVFMIAAVMNGKASFSDFGPHAAGHALPVPVLSWLDIARHLYNISHSAVMFAVMFAIAWVILKRPLWEMSGWLLHILIDIPIHKAEFFPTPVFWPISNWHFTHGTNWGNWTFQIINYSAIIIVFIVLTIWQKYGRKH